MITQTNCSLIICIYCILLHIIEDYKDCVMIALFCHMCKYSMYFVVVFFCSHLEELKKSVRITQHYTLSVAGCLLVDFYF